MKEGLNRAAVRRIATAFAAVSPSFAPRTFEKNALKGLSKLELRARVNHIIEALHSALPQDFEAAAPLFQAIPKQWDYGDPSDPLRGFAAWPIIDYIAAHGLDHPKTALPLLSRLTPLFSAEFAIRPFFTHHFTLTYATVQGWLTDPCEHVRRLVSEGSRPRLPWGTHLNAFISDPTPLIPLLEALKDDPSAYVRKSVANNLNDISKDHPQRVVDIGHQWLSAAQGNIKQRQQIVKHATRTLIKAGYLPAFELHGYPSPACLTIEQFKLNKKRVTIGGELQCRVALRSNTEQKQPLIIDYAIHLLRANGTHTRKVFKFKTISLKGHETVRLNASHSFKMVTVRRYYPGEHFFELIINGQSYEQEKFTLL